MISIRRLKGGPGPGGEAAWRYLLRTTVVGDVGEDRKLSESSLAHYYANSGTPPGRFLGRGCLELDGGVGVAPDTAVTEEHLRRIFRDGADPLSGEVLGRKMREDGVAAFDLTFSLPKSVSVAFALASQAQREQIYEIHKRAIELTLDYAEREVFRTRAGTDGVIVDRTTGVVGAAFTHWDSRCGDPQLHDHVAVMNRVRSARDGEWRTLDSRSLHKRTVELSEFHQSLTMSLLAKELGWGWEGLERRHSQVPKWEVEGVPVALMTEFSKRADMIEAEKVRLFNAFERDHGRAPAGAEVIKLRQQATLSTRPTKNSRSLVDATVDWQDRAQPFLDGRQPSEFVAALAQAPVLWRAEDFSEDFTRTLGREVAQVVSFAKSTFSWSNLAAETSRQLRELLWHEASDLEAMIQRVTNAAAAAATVLNTPSTLTMPEILKRRDVTEGFESSQNIYYSSQLLIETEDDLLALSRELGAPAVAPAVVAAVAASPLPGRDYGVNADQAKALAAVATSGYRVDLLSAAAGTGKSTAMAALKEAWEREYGEGSVLGLAPTAGAAEVLGLELGIPTENVTKFLFERARLHEHVDWLATVTERHFVASRLGQDTTKLAELRAEAEERIHKYEPGAGRLVIVDEASLATTWQLHELARVCADQGAKLLLVGDEAQLGSVDAGGMFTTMVNERGADVATLDTVMRFNAEWEAAASLLVREGNFAGFAAYHQHDRVRSGRREDMTDAIYGAWRADRGRGLSTLMLAGDGATIRALNIRAHTDRRAAGEVWGEVAIADDVVAGFGDLVVTRKNARQFTTDEGTWVKNGDVWTIENRDEAGGLIVRHADSGELVTLDPDYVADHVELAYAMTVHRAQGRTVDTCHLLVDADTSREVCYVGLTRGRDANVLYVDTHEDPDRGLEDHPEPVVDVDVILSSIMTHSSVQRSAHDVMDDLAREAGSVKRLIAEYESLAALSDATDWRVVLSDNLSSPRAGVTVPPGLVREILAGEGWSSLVATMRRATAAGVDLSAVLPALVNERELDTAVDAATVLDWRLQRALDRRAVVEPETLIVGLFPVAGEGPELASDVVTALRERQAAIEERCAYALEEALDTGAEWARALGAAPEGEQGLAWRDLALTVAGYRERWGVTADTPLGAYPGHSKTQAAQYARARTALTQLEQLAGSAASPTSRAARGLRPLTGLPSLDGSRPSLEESRPDPERDL